MSPAMNTSSSFTLTASPVRRLADTASNRDLLESEAAKDGKASIVAKQGNDVLLLSGAFHTASKIGRLSADQGISKGDSLRLNGADASVLYTDDGFKEVDLSHVAVAIIDTGLQTDHPALKGSKVLPGYNFKTHDGNVTDHNGHGTHVAGIIAGDLPSKGVNGVAQGATLLPINIAIGWSANPDIMPRMAEAIRYAVDHGAKVINISDGIDMHKPLMQKIHGSKQHLVDEALQYAETKGVVVVVAAGNQGNDSSSDPKDNVMYPATVPTVVAISSLDDTDPKKGPALRFTSSTGPGVDLAAPGTNIVSSFPGSKTKTLSGTSMAAPYVTGVVAQIIARHPDWTPAQIREQLYKTAADLGQPGKDIQYGYGAIDPFKAIYGQ